MTIDDLRRTGKRLMTEIPPLAEGPCGGTALGRGAGGDRTFQVDRRAEEIIFEEAEKLGEPLTIISEEFGTKDIHSGGPRLLVDPIDGSRNAVSGVPLFSTSIALIQGDTIGDISLGYILNIISGDEYWAEKGKGGYLNGRRLATQQDDVMRVIGYEAMTPARDIPKIMPLLSLYNRARCFGSTALDLAFLAQGALSTFVTPVPSRSFDFAAGYLLVREAGGIVTDLHGQEIIGVSADIRRSTPLLASPNKALHKHVLEVLLG